jgi:hypothetical protein
MENANLAAVHSHDEFPSEGLIKYSLHMIRRLELKYSQQHLDQFLETLIHVGVVVFRRDGTRSFRYLMTWYPDWVGMTQIKPAVVTFGELGSGKRFHCSKS